MSKKDRKAMAVINPVTENGQNALEVADNANHATNLTIDNVSPDGLKKSVAELMAETEIKFTQGSTIKEVSEDLQEYLTCYSPELRARTRELGKGSGGRILDETIARFYVVSGIGLSRNDLQRILIAANSERSDVSGYCNTFATSENEEMRSGCPKRVARFKKNGLYCVTAR